MDWSVHIRAADGVDARALADDVIASVRHETLIVHGRDDRVIPLA